MCASPVLFPCMDELDHTSTGRRTADEIGLCHGVPLSEMPAWPSVRSRSSPRRGGQASRWSHEARKGLHPCRRGGWSMCRANCRVQGDRLISRRCGRGRYRSLRWQLSLDRSFRSKGPIIAAAERCCSKRINGAARDEARQGVYGVKQQRSHFCIFSDFHSHHNSTCLRRMRG